MRLDKYLSDITPRTRKEIKSDIRQGFVLVNGIKANDPGAHILAGDEVTYKGVRVEYEAHVYYMMNKPAGVVSATEDSVHRTVIDLIDGNDIRRGLFPVGRLDIDTTGLLLITNDGELGHRLLSPSRHIGKSYLVRVDGRITEQCRMSFAAGIDLGDFVTLPASIAPASSESLALLCGAEGDTECCAIVTIREGKFHQIKRMFENQGLSVLYLKRLSMGELRLDESLKEGCYRRLTPGELASLG